MRKRRDREEEHAILMIFPHGDAIDPRKGNEIRVNYLLTELARKGRVCLFDELGSRGGGDDGIEKRSYHPINIGGHHLGSFFADFNPSFFFELKKAILSFDPDTIIVSYPHGILVTRILSKLLARDFKIIYDAHDVERVLRKQVTMTEKDRSWLSRMLIYLSDIFFEKISISLSDHIITVSEGDARDFMELYCISPDRLTTIPIGTRLLDRGNYDKNECKKALGLDPDKCVVLFHGVYDYSPNREAADLIEQRIAKEFHNDQDVQFVIAGRGAPVRSTGNLRYIGYIDDLQQLLMASDVAIVPILKGGGTRVKIFDYMSAMIPVLTTTKGIEGIDVNNGYHALVVGDVGDEFISDLRRLTNDPNLRYSLASRAMDLIKAKYEVGRISENLWRLISDLSEE